MKYEGPWCLREWGLHLYCHNSGIYYSLNANFATQVHVFLHSCSLVCSESFGGDWAFRKCDQPGGSRLQQKAEVLTVVGWSSFHVSYLNKLYVTRLSITLLSPKRQCLLSPCLSDLELIPSNQKSHYNLPPLSWFIPGILSD